MTGSGVHMRFPGNRFSERWRGIDWSIFIAIILLLGAGLLMSLAASPSAAMRLGHEDVFFFFKRHAVFTTIGLVVLFIVSFFDRSQVRRAAMIIFLVVLGLLVFILVGGYEINGARRWIRLGGFSLQPSEFLKPAFIVLAAWLLAQRVSHTARIWSVLACACFVVALGLLLLQPDVGQSVLLTVAFCVTFFVSGLSWRWICVFAGGGAALSGFLYTMLPHVRFRINSFVNPSDHDTYQIDTATAAIERGGLFGTGPGEGKIKTVLPDAHTDFIYAVLSEEFGYVAAIAVISAYAFIVWKGFYAATRLHDPFARAAACGLFALFGLQAAMHIGVNISLVPPKGVTLPFISYGGSSTIGTALTLGLALALTGRCKRFRGAY